MRSGRAWRSRMSSNDTANPGAAADAQVAERAEDDVFS